MENIIPFNKPYLTGQELSYIKDSVYRGQLSGNGYYTNKCQTFFENQYGFKKALLTTSCTDALEMSAILANLGPTDEVIVPSFTFVSTALAFVRQGAKVIFADSSKDNPQIDVTKIESLITQRTKAIVVVHYAGFSCDMDRIMSLSKKHNLIVIEDAAQAIESYYKNKRLGTFGHFATFSFHETKNIISGEGGLLAINDSRYVQRAEIVWEKGTNRADFFRGKINKYEWVDIGSSFLPSELTAAFLWAQIENLGNIQKKRTFIWNNYSKHLQRWANHKNIKLMSMPKYNAHNAHMFYMLCESNQQRNAIIEHMNSKNILLVSHYLSLHSSPFYEKHYVGRDLKNSDYFTNVLIRLPLFYELNVFDVIKELVKY